MVCKHLSTLTSVGLDFSGPIRVSVFLSVAWKKHILGSNANKNILGRKWQLLLCTDLLLWIFSSTVGLLQEGSWDLC